jgi:hypothetical protein
VAFATAVVTAARTTTATTGHYGSACVRTFFTVLAAVAAPPGVLAPASTVTSDADQIVDAVAVDSSTTGIASGAACTTFGVRAPVTSPTATTTGDHQIGAIVDARRSARSTGAFDGC